MSLYSGLGLVSWSLPVAVPCRLPCGPFASLLPLPHRPSVYALLCYVVPDTLVHLSAASVSLLEPGFGRAYGSEHFAFKILSICGLQSTGLLLCPHMSLYVHLLPCDVVPCPATLFVVYTRF